MDITDGYDNLDFVLSEPGLIQDTRIEDQAAAESGLDADVPVRLALAAFDHSRVTRTPATMCLIRFLAPAGQANAGDEPQRILERIQGAIRSPDFCARSSRGDYAIGLADCDIDTARKRVALMIRLVQLDAAYDASTSVWIGMTSVDGVDSAEGMRTALLACDLAAFQPSGHVEVIEL